MRDNNNTLWSYIEKYGYPGQDRDIKMMQKYGQDHVGDMANGDVMEKMGQEAIEAVTGWKITLTTGYNPVDSDEGIEFKHDLIWPKTKNLFVECYERQTFGDAWEPRGPNYPDVRWFCIGSCYVDEPFFFTYRAEDLRKLEGDRRLVENGKNNNTKGFLLSPDDQLEYAINVFRRIDGEWKAWKLDNKRRKASYAYEMIFRTEGMFDNTEN